MSLSGTAFGTPVLQAGFLWSSTVMALVGVAAGTALGLYGFLTKSDPGEGFRPGKLLRTAVVYGVAGALVAPGAGQLSIDAFESQAAFTVVGGSVVEMGVTKVDHLLRGTRDHRLRTAANAAADSAVPDREEIAAEVEERVRRTGSEDQPPAAKPKYADDARSTVDVR